MDRELEGKGGNGEKPGGKGEMEKNQGERGIKQGKTRGLGKEKRG